jgi:hypothetical protein
MKRKREIIGQAMALIAGFGAELGRPEQKFLSDLILGILCSQSCLLSEITRAIASSEDLKTVYKRLDINLGKYDLHRAYEKAQRRMISKLDESYLLIFDPSEIVKPYGKKMEGLHKVRDGSAPPRLVWDRKQNKYKRTPVLAPGYPLRVAIALATSGDIVPLELSLYSVASENFLSENDEHIQPLTSLLIRANLKPTLVLDRGFDCYAMIRHFCELNQKFIIRLKSNRKYKLPGALTNPDVDNFSREEMIKKHSFLKTKAVVTYTKKGITQSYLFDFTASHVQLLPEHKKKNAIRNSDDLDLLTLVRVRIHKDKGTPVLYLLTNARPTTAEDLEKIGRAYIARWNIEEYIRFLKQHFEVEGFLVRDLSRMKNLMKAVYIATVVVHILTDRNSIKGQRAHHFLIDQALEIAAPKKTRDFFLYAYGRGLANIVASNKALLKRINTGLEMSDEIPSNQLSFSVLE